MAKKYLDNNGLLYLWSKIKATFVADFGYDSSTHQITKTKNGSVSNIVAVPYRTSDLTNDSGFVTTSDIPEGASASPTSPKMDGTASVGTETAFARGDHRHPSDTTKVDKVTGMGLSTNDYTTEEKNKLAGIASGAEVNVNADWNATSGDAKILNKPAIPSTAADVGAIPTSAKGAASGVCPLDANSKVDASYLPSYVDDVIEAYVRSSQTELGQNWLATGSASGTVITPETGKIYVLMNSSTNYEANTQFRWGGTAYVKLADGGVSAITNAEIDTIVAS